MTEAFNRKLTVTNCTVATSGVGRNNKPYTIYDIEAVTEDGSPVDKRLRSFEACPLGELHTYKLEPYLKDGEVRNYTIARVHERLGPRVERLERLVAELLVRLESQA